MLSSAVETAAVVVAFSLSCGIFCFEGGHPDSPNSPLLHIVLPVVVAGLSLGSLVLLYLWRSHRGGFHVNKMTFCILPFQR